MCSLKNLPINCSLYEEKKHVDYDIQCTRIYVKLVYMYDGAYGVMDETAL